MHLLLFYLSITLSISFLFFTPLPMSIWYLCSPSERGPMEFPGLINEQTLTDGQKLTSVSMHHRASGGPLLKREKRLDSLDRFTRQQHDMSHCVVLPSRTDKSLLKNFEALRQFYISTPICGNLRIFYICNFRCIYIWIYHTHKLTLLAGVSIVATHSFGDVHLRLWCGLTHINCIFCWDLLVFVFLFLDFPCCSQAGWAWPSSGFCFHLHTPAAWFNVINSLTCTAEKTGSLVHSSPVCRWPSPGNTGHL